MGASPQPHMIGSTTSSGSGMLQNPFLSTALMQPQPQPLMMMVGGGSGGGGGHPTTGVATTTSGNGYVNPFMSAAGGAVMGQHALAGLPQMKQAGASSSSTSLLDL